LLVGSVKRKGSVKRRGSVKRKGSVRIEVVRRENCKEGVKVKLKGE